MPIYFGLTTPTLPLTIDSIGNGWNETQIQRPEGYHAYHWLQTEHGEGDVFICNQHIPLPQGSAILIAPHIPHAYRAVTKPWITAFATFCGTLESSIPRIVGAAPYMLTSSSADFSYQDWIDGIVAAHEAHRIDPMKLSLECYRFLMRFHHAQPENDHTLHPLYIQYVAPAISEIEAGYGEDITVQSIADVLHITPQYLSRLFGRFLGCSTYQYLSAYRINKAKELLAGPVKLSVEQVAIQTGYHDTSHFIASFKRATGYTAREFRKLHR